MTDAELARMARFGRGRGHQVDRLTVCIVVAAPNEGYDVVSAVDSTKAPPVAQATKAMRRTLPQCVGWVEDYAQSAKTAHAVPVRPSPTAMAASTRFLRPTLANMSARNTSVNGMTIEEIVDHG